LVTAAEHAVQLQSGDHVTYVGNTLADRMQHHGWLETYIQALYPDLNLTFRDLGFPGDELKTRNRSANFGSPDQWMTKVESDVVFCFFGYNEAFRGPAGLARFRADLADTIDGMLAQKYNGKSAPRLVFFSPIAHENVHRHTLPDGSANNANLVIYTQAMSEVCAAKKVPFVDLFTPTLELYAAADQPLTMNGVHLLEHGNRALAQVITKSLFSKDVSMSGKGESELQRLREAVLDKNLHWFSRYRVVDGYNVYGGRSSLNWFGMSNADVMKREMEIFDVMTANRDKRVWAVADGRDLIVKDDNLPEVLKVKTNKPGKLKNEKHPYFNGLESISKMTVAKGMEVNLFASEEMFPEMVNPVQMAVDTDGRLFASVWPSYPHWNPTKPRTDRIVCLPDEDGDGVADKCTIFADKLNTVTGFEFWGGGMLVAAPPEIWFLKDTDGDDKADVKIRMLQGVSSADSHHSANAVVIGPDGGMYWSRGIFNIASMETPTHTYRSKSSGVHRFDPRTFEMSFVFPIGPNPHGDIFDQWGYQFANDGTGGTGSYVNIGKGIGNKKWFNKRVRPVAATGILSSPHFPEKNNGNFLICNTIGFLGVLQHEVKYNGADITAVEVEPILVSTDQNFRPTDVEIGGDGALYVSDWCNVLIGHMQHNIRDPNRDHAHGRIYRVTHKGSPLMKPAKMKGKPISEVCENFFSLANSVRYRARLELSGRATDDIVAQVAAFASGLNPSNASKGRNEAQALLECLWVFEEHRIPTMPLLKKVLQADEPRIRAAAIRTLGHWGTKVKDWHPTLKEGARDESALVRAEAVKAAVSFEGLPAAEIIFEAATRPTDAELDVVIRYARGNLNVDKIAKDAIAAGSELSSAAQAYLLLSASVADLLKLDRTEAVYEAILSRPKVRVVHLRESLTGLAIIRKENKAILLLNLIEEGDKGDQAGIAGLAQLLAEATAAELSSLGDRIERLALGATTPEVREAAYAAWITANGSGDDAFLAATMNKDRLRDFLHGVPAVASRELRSDLYTKVQPLTVEMPSRLQAESGGSSFQQPGILVDYFYPSANNVALSTLAKMKPKASGIVPEIVINVPQRKQADRFALRFTGNIQIPRAGKYTFSTNSDDGSRLYIGDKLIVNNDGNHGMVKKSGSIELPVGSHPLIVTYFDNGGGDGLQVTWAGPGFREQKIPANRLALSGGETLHDVAIASLASIPGHDAEKVHDLCSLVKAGLHRPAAIRALRSVPVKAWPAAEIRPLVDNLVGYLSEIPAEFRTRGDAMVAVALAKSLAPRLPADVAKRLENRLQNLDVRVIAIGTVPHRMIFDKETIAVQAGKPVEFRFSNTDNMPHNFAILQPGALEEIGMLAEATARDADAMDRQFIPKSDKILLASRKLEPGENQALSFVAPSTPGVYPYVCTYPGHWRRMYGTLYVVANLPQYQADPAAYLAANPLPIRDELLKFNTRNREWKIADLVSDVKPLPMGRSFEVGKQLFKVAACVSCHKLDNEGQVFGPDLAKLDAKKQTTEHILTSIVEPSKEIDEKYQSYTFLLDSGKAVTGMIIEETDDVVKIVIDPVAKGKPSVIKKSQIEERVKSKVSLMPQGLINKLSREEILDLVAYVFARGDKKHKLFEAHHH
jgi:putative heme-binding domain-containing protein